MVEEFSSDDIKKKIDVILKEPEIRFCGLIDPDGELVAGGFDSSIVPMLNDKQRRQMYQELAHRVANRQGFDADLGRVKYSASRRENAVMLSFPFGKYIVLVMANPGINIDRFAWEILNKLGRQWSEYDSL
ncbi:hypothetical protein Nisw_03000 [Candidatus Nitrosopumilus sp. SW]|uniref:DUF6659 family protein n=1 Tax=Candidatus Nitrosopumilus sp. SW TaxID=2508726 RepID=UPI001150EAAA|nr:DUF6659 family protein [Candidatus Nitrosopumilus sp. SW]QDI88574.1 hypothetical protein Nisw_03000 [Candidatus Nitrosopumilus sp. SW]